MAVRQLCGLPRRLEVERDGLAWRLDLAESIDSRSGCAVGLNRLRLPLRAPSIPWSSRIGHWRQCWRTDASTRSRGGKYRMRLRLRAGGVRGGKAPGEHRAQPFGSLACDCGANDARASDDPTVATEIYSSWPLETALHLNHTPRGR